MATETLNLYLSVGTIALQIVSAAFLVLYFAQKRIPDLQDIGAQISRSGLWIGLALSLGASFMTLYYSNVLGFAPCDLCWWQRICLYPQVLLFAIALWRKDASVALYSIALSVLGLGVAIYHHLLQVYPAGNLPCPSQGPSCAQITFIEFGYVTFPMMAVALFAFLIVVMLFVRVREAR